MGEVSCRITLLSMNEVRKLGWISQEEDGSVVGNDVPIAFLGPHLNRKTSWITGEIVRARLATDCRETNSDGTFLALSAEDVGSTQVVERVGADEFTMSTTALRMDDSFWDTLTIEVGEEVDQVATDYQRRNHLRSAD